MHKILLIVLLILSNTIISEIPLENINGLFSSINPAYAEWAPIHGVIGAKTNWLDTIFSYEVKHNSKTDYDRFIVKEYADETHVARLLKYLFYQDPNDKKIRVTKLATLVGSYLTPENIADIIYYIFQHEHLKKQNLPEQDFKNTVEKQENDFAKLLYQHGVKIRKPAALKPFIKTLRNAHQDCLDLTRHSPHTFSMIILTYLFLKLNSKQEYIRFFERLSQHTIPGTAQSLLSNTYNKDHILNDQFKSINCDTVHVFLKHLFNNQNNENFLQAQYELLVLGGLIYKICSPSLHPFPTYKDVTIDIDSNGTIEKFPDCVETCLRGFINELIFSNNKFDSTILEKAGLKPIAKVKQFYENSATITNIASQQIHNEWALIVSNIKNYPIEYRTDNHHGALCEIKSTLANTINSLRYLCGQDITTPITKESFVHYFKNISEQISSIYNGIKIIKLTQVNFYYDEELDQKQIENNDITDPDTILDDEMEASLTFEITFFHNNITTTEKFIWYIQNAHSRIEAYNLNPLPNPFFSSLLPYATLKNYLGINVVGLYSLGLKNILESLVHLAQSPYLQNYLYHVIDPNNPTITKAIIETILHSTVHNSIPSDFIAYLLPKVLNSQLKALIPLIVNSRNTRVITDYFSRLKSYEKIIDIRILFASEIAKQQKNNAYFIINELLIDPKVQEYVYWGDLIDALFNSKNPIYIERIMRASMGLPQQGSISGQTSKETGMLSDIMISQLIINGDHTILDIYMDILNQLSTAQKKQWIKKCIDSLLTINVKIIQHKDDIYQFIINNKENIDNINYYIPLFKQTGHTELVTML